MHRNIFNITILFLTTALFTTLFTPAESVFYQKPYYSNPYYNNGYSRVYPNYNYTSANIYPQNIYPSSIYPPNIYPRKDTVWRKITNYFSGQLTGFTPPVQHSIYTPDTSSVTEYSSPFGGKKYRTNSLGSSSGSSITILD